MAKHLFYLTNNQLTATVWDKGVQSEPQSFDHYPSGWEKFSNYVESYRHIPSSFLVDVIEEDFQRDTIPHVFGLTKQNLIQRRLTFLYRDTPYRRASQQGREKEGRKNDQMLFSALTNMQLLAPWVEILQKQKMDVTGVFSVALLTQFIFKKLNLGSAPALIVTHQSSGLRQSFFQDGYLRFSRLSPETAWSPESIAETTDAEMAKTRQFLASTRLLARGADLNIVAIADAKIIHHLQPRCLNEGGLHYSFVNLHEAKPLFDMDRPMELHVCDALFLSLLANRRIPSHYATDEQKRAQQLSQARTALNILSVATISAALLWAAKDGLDAFHASKTARQAQQETKNTLAKYHVTLATMPMTVANPHDMRVAVELEQMIKTNGPTPAAIFSIISSALDDIPQIKIQDINWEVSAMDDVALDPTNAPVQSVTGEIVPIAGSFIGVPKKPTEIIKIEGEVSPFTNDYRSALEVVQQLITQLQKNTQIHVELTKPPLDTRPTVKLESQSGNDAALAKPQFSLKLTWKTQVGN